MEDKIQELENEVSTLKNNTEPKTFSSDLLDFYLRKYNTLIVEVEDERLKNIEKEISELESDQQTEQSQVEELESANNDYQSSLNHYNHWQEDLMIKEEKVNDITYEYNKSCNELYKEINALNKTYNEKINYYTCLTDSLKDHEITKEVFDSKIGDLLKYFSSIGVDQSKKLLDLIQQVKELTNKYNDDVYQLNADIIDLQNAISQINLDSPEQLLIEEYKKAENIQLAINRKTHAKETLIEMFKELRVSQEKELSNLYEYLNLIEESKYNIAEKLDNKISELVEQYRNSETKEHKYNVLLDEYNSVLKDIYNYEPIVEEVKIHQEDYSKKKDLCNSLIKNLSEMRTYITNSYNVINSNQQYFKFFEDYIYAKKRIIELNASTKELEKQNKENNELRKAYVMDPYAKLKLDELDAIIYENDQRLRNEFYEVESLNKKINDSKLINEELFKIIDNKEKIEQIIPELEKQINSIKENMDKLASIISEKSEVIKDYKLKSNRKSELEKELSKYEENNN